MATIELFELHPIGERYSAQVSTERLKVENEGLSCFAITF